MISSEFLRVPKPTSQHPWCVSSLVQAAIMSHQISATVRMVLPASRIIISTVFFTLQPCPSFYKVQIYPMLKLFNGSPLPSGESADSQLWQVKPSTTHPYEALPSSCTWSSFQTEQLEKAQTQHAFLALGCFMSCCLCLGYPSPSWLILQLTSFPCLLRAGSLCSSGPLTCPFAARQVHPHHALLFLTVWATYTSRLKLFVARDSYIRPVCPYLHWHTPAAWHAENSNKLCWINEYTVGCSSPHFAIIYHKSLFHFLKDCLQS